MATIGRLNYQITANTDGFTKGITATRRELSHAKQIMRQTQTPVEQLQAETARLDSLMRKGAIDLETRNRRLEQLRRKIPEVVAEEKRHQAAMQRGQQIAESMRSPIERYKLQLGELRQLYQRGVIDQDTYRRGMGQLLGQQLQMIPSTGRFGSLLSTGLHPALLAVAAAAIAVTAAYRIAVSIVRSLTTVVLEQAQALDKVAKQSRKLGESAQAMLEMGFAAEQLAGTDFQTFQTALQRLSRRVSQTAAGVVSSADQVAGAAKPMGAVGQLLAELGLDAQQLNLLSPTEQFMELTRAMENVENPADRLRVMFTLLDTEGVALVNMAGAGGEAIEQLRQQFRDLYGVTSDADLAGVETMNDRLNEASKIFDGLKTELTTQLAPTIAAAVEWFIELTREGSQSGQALRETIAFLPPLFGAVVDFANVVLGKLQQKQAEVMAVGATALRVAAALDTAMSLMSPGRGVNQQLQTMASSFRETTRQIAEESRQRLEDGLSGATSRRAQQILDGIELPDFAAGREQAALQAQQEAAQQAAMQLVGSVTEVTASLQEQIDTFGMSAEQVALWKLQQQGANEATVELVRGLQDQVAALEAHEAAVAQAREAQQAVEQYTDSLREQLATMGMSTREAELWKLAQQGASAAAIEQARSIGAALDDSREYLDLLERGRQLTEANLGPLDKLRRARSDLQKLRDVGAIDARTYALELNRAIEESRRDLPELEPVRIRFDGTGINQAVEGAASQLARLEAQREFFAAGGRDLGRIGVDVDEPEDNSSEAEALVRFDRMVSLLEQLAAAERDKSARRDAPTAGTPMVPVRPAGLGALS